MHRSLHRLDTTGTLCPIPILLTEREMAKLAPGDRLEVVGDDPGIREDMPAWCASTGHRLERLDEHEGRIVCIVEKVAGPPAP